MMNWAAKIIAGSDQFWIYQVIWMRNTSKIHICKIRSHHNISIEWFLISKCKINYFSLLSAGRQIPSFPEKLECHNFLCSLSPWFAHQTTTTLHSRLLYLVVAHIININTYNWSSGWRVELCCIVWIVCKEKCYCFSE